MLAADSEDPLGLDRIYVQARRYASDNVIHRPKIHDLRMDEDFYEGL